MERETSLELSVEYGSSGQREQIVQRTRYCSRIQFVSSQAQTSFVRTSLDGPVLSSPPKSKTIVPLDAAPAGLRPPGFWAGVTCCHVDPFQTHVSLRRSPPP